MKYRTRAEMDDDPLIVREIIVEDSEPQWSGLLDAEGNKLFRVADSVPMGFHRK